MAATPVNAPVITLAATSAGAYTRMDGVPVTQTATSSSLARGDLDWRDIVNPK